jgi:SAM-dependent methyltransferase
MEGTRYDGIAAWYDETFRPSLSDAEVDALQRLLGPGEGRCLDLGCGTGVAAPALTDLGWTVVGTDASGPMLEIARARELDVVAASVDALPFADESFDAAVSIWTHTDVGDFAAALREATRVLRAGAPLVYLGAHPCFIGPHSRFVGAVGVPSLMPGYRREGPYDGGPSISPEGLRAKVGATHMSLGRFLQAFVDAGLRLERFAELDDDRDYPHMVGLRSRR